MTYEQYWYGDPLMVRAFYLADQQRQKQRDYDSWLLGAYFRIALDSTVGNMFRKNKNESSEYPKFPFTYIEDEHEKERHRKDESERERLRLVAYLNSVATAKRRQEKNS